MIAWVETVCRTWGRDQRRVLLGGRWVHSIAGREWDFDGFPSRSMSDKIFREHFAAMSGVVEQHYPEVQDPEAWHVHRVYLEQPIRERTMMVGKYIAHARWKSIATICGFLFPDGRLDKDNYYQTWDRIHTRIDCEPREQLPDFVRTIARGSGVGSQAA